MHELLVDGCTYEMSDTRMRQLRDSGAIIQEGGFWIVNDGYHNFTYEQVMWFLDLYGE